MINTESVEPLVIKEYLNGTSRDKIAQIVGISSGKTSNIIKDWKYKINISDIQELHDFYVEVKKARISIYQCVQGYIMFQMMKHLGIIVDDDDDDDENKFGNTNTIKDPNNNNKINYKEFSSFANYIYLYCNNNWIEPHMVFSLIDDLHQFIPGSSVLSKLSNTINYSSNNNMGSSLPYSDQNKKNYIIDKDAPLISQVSSFIDQKKNEYRQLEDYKKNLENEMGYLEIQRNILKAENDELKEDNKKII